MNEKCSQSGKVIHLSEGKAAAHLRWHKENDPTYNGVVYHCPYCGFYHIGRGKQGEHKNKYK